MILMMKTLSGMTQNLADAMATGMDDNKMGTLAGLMDEVSTHMLRMFDMMNNRSATEGEMHTLQIGINDTEVKIKQQIHSNGQAVKAVDVGNKNCPVNGALIDEKTKVTYEYKGKIYNFLSQMCVESFKKDPGKYIAALDKPTESLGHEGHKMLHNHGQ
jgi:YHS domain-containing protein